MNATQQDRLVVGVGAVGRDVVVDLGLRFPELAERCLTIDARNSSSQMSESQANQLALSNSDQTDSANSSTDWSRYFWRQRQKIASVLEGVRNVITVTDLGEDQEVDGAWVISFLANKKGGNTCTIAMAPSEGLLGINDTLRLDQRISTLARHTSTLFLFRQTEHSENKCQIANLIHWQFLENM